jgi:hypothetical protein
VKREDSLNVKVDPVIHLNNNLSPDAFPTRSLSNDELNNSINLITPHIDDSKFRNILLVNQMSFSSDHPLSKVSSSVLERNSLTVFIFM